MVFTDPPYNVPISGHAGGLGAIKHRDFVMASGEMTASEFTSFLERAFKNLAAHSVDLAPLAMVPLRGFGGDGAWCRCNRKGSSNVARQNPRNDQVCARPERR